MKCLWILQWMVSRWCRFERRPSWYIYTARPRCDDPSYRRPSLVASKQQWPTVTSALSACEHYRPKVKCWPGALSVVYLRAMFHYHSGYYMHDSQKNMAMSPSGPRTKNDFAGEGQQQFTRLERSNTKISLVAFTRFDDQNWNKDLITMPQSSARVGACHVTRRRY
jgi:hypothetical protein